MPSQNVNALTNELYEALRIDYLEQIKKEDSDDSSESSTATYESIVLDMMIIDLLLEKYIDGETMGQFLGGPDTRQVELSELILKSDALRTARADQSLFAIVDSTAYLATQLAMACYDDWEENFDDGDWRLQAMRSNKDSTSTNKPKDPNSQPKPWD